MVAVLYLGPEEKYRNFPKIVARLALVIVASLSLIKLVVAGFPFWSWGFFMFTLWGASSGLVWELLGDLNWQRAEQVEVIRRANIGLVIGTYNAIVLVMCFGRWHLAFSFIVSWISSFFAFELLLNIRDQGGKVRTQVVLGLCQITDVVLCVVVRNSAVNPVVYKNLIAANILNVISFPLSRTWIFDGLSTVALVLVFLALEDFGKPTFASPLNWQHDLLLIAGVFVGLLSVITKPVLRHQFRYWIVNALYSTLYTTVFTITNVPPPPPPSFVSGNVIAFAKYYENHPHAYPVDVLSPKEIPKNQQFPLLLQQLDTGMKMFSLLNRYFPQTTVSVPPSRKPRIDSQRTAEFYVDRIVQEYGTNTRYAAPQTLVTWHDAGQSLVWLVLYGHCSSMLQRLSPDDLQRGELRSCTHKLDFHWLRKYTAKPFYRGYGGRAFFQYDPKSECKLTLMYVTDCNDTSDEVLLPVAAHSDLVFSSIRAISSSTKLEVVVGYHLTGIHLFCSVLSLALYNVFDVVCVIPQHTHPFRTVLQMHFYNHVLVSEKTTPHLLDQTAVLSQVFALQHSSLAEFVGDYFRSLVFGSDADLETREQVLTNGEGPLPENSQIHWQQSYMRIFRAYASDVVDAIWENDEHLVADELMRKFYAELDHICRSRGDNAYGFPDRYEKFETKQGATLFLADSIFINTVMHEVYGTRVPTYATDDRIVPGQVPFDQGPATLDSYMSMLWVDTVTSRVRYPKLLDQDPTIVFAPTEPKLVPRLVELFQRMRAELKALQATWTGTTHQNDINVEFNRVIPTDLEITAGY